MTWHTIIQPVVSRAIGQCGLTRAGVVRLLAHLHGDLPARADVLRMKREIRDPDYFAYRLNFVDGGKRHYCVFRVDDVKAPGFLFVEDLANS